MSNNGSSLHCIATEALEVIQNAASQAPGPVPLDYIGGLVTLNGFKPLWGKEYLQFGTMNKNSNVDGSATDTITTYNLYAHITIYFA